MAELGRPSAIAREPSGRIRPTFGHQKGDYYDRKWREAAEVRFVTGSAVLGPMGPDLVPVDIPRAPKFVQYHQGEKAPKLEEISKAVLEDLK